MKTHLPLALQEVWQQQGFGLPTAIQQTLYEPMCQGQSFVAISPTGTGKTLAYALPILTRIQSNRQLQAVIVAPSQELGKQIGTVIQQWATPLDVNVQLLLGGANFKRQQEALKEKPEILVVTPGRFAEHITKTRKLKLHTVQTVVFDEADYLLNQEDAKAVQQLQKHFLRDTQYVWVSATYGESLQQLVAQGINLYQIDNAVESSTVSHYYLITHNRQKVDQLKRLAQIDGMQAIVFFEQINQVEEVAAKLLYQGIKVSVLHGQLSKQERELALRLFSQGDTVYLLTTDMAARGLDIPAIPYVIHYNRVDALDTYIHRSGRTGRMNQEGQVLSLVNEQEYRDLTALLGKNIPSLQERIVHTKQLVLPIEKSTKEISQRPVRQPTLKEKVAHGSTKTTVKKKKSRHRQQKK